MTLTRKQREDLRAQLQPLVREIFDSPELKSTVEAEVQNHLRSGGSSTGYADMILEGTPGRGPAGQTLRRNRELPKGARLFARLGLVCALGRGDSQAMHDAARTLDIEDEFRKAQSAGSAEGGGLLIADDLADDLIELLRPLSVIRRIGAREVEIPRGTKRTPRLDIGATSGYVGEGQAIPAADLKFGDVSLVARKCATLVVLSAELARFAQNADIDSIIVEDMLASISTTEDVAMLFGSGSENEPLGIIEQAATANVFDADPTNSVATIVSDLRTIMGKLTDNDVPMRRPVWIWSPRTSNFLKTLIGANDQFVFRSEIEQNRLFNWPVFETNNIPNDQGAGNDESSIIVCDASEIMLGDVRAVAVDRSDQATVTIDGVLTSLFETDRAAVRVRQWNDIRARHDVSVAVMNAVTWGA